METVYQLNREDLRNELKLLIQETIRAELWDKPTDNHNFSEQPLSQRDAIKFLGKSRQTFHSWRKKGIIKGYYIGGRVYYKKSELLASMKTEKIE